MKSIRRGFFVVILFGTFCLEDMHEANAQAASSLLYRNVENNFNNLTDRINENFNTAASINNILSDKGLSYSYSLYKTAEIMPEFFYDNYPNDNSRENNARLRLNEGGYSWYRINTSNFEQNKMVNEESYKGNSYGLFYGRGKLSGRSLFGFALTADKNIIKMNKENIEIVNLGISTYIRKNTLNSQIFISAVLAAFLNNIKERTDYRSYQIASMSNVGIDKNFLILEGFLKTNSSVIEPNDGVFNLEGRTQFVTSLKGGGRITLRNMLNVSRRSFTIKPEFFYEKSALFFNSSDKSNTYSKEPTKINNSADIGRVETRYGFNVDWNFSRMGSPNIRLSCSNSRSDSGYVNESYSVGVTYILY